MPLVPFKLFNDETRLIVHNDCLYKLKLTNKSEISLTETSSGQRDEMNTELTKVIRAILFLIKAEKNIPRKIHTPCFTVCVAVKFWKIALKLGFSKNGSRLKCGHLIELMLKESRTQEKEGSETRAESPLESNVENENIQQFGHMGLRQFVIDSDDSDSKNGSSSKDITVCKSSEHSKSAANEYNNTVSTDIDGLAENLVKSFRIPDSLHNQTKPSDQTPIISDQAVHAQINSDSAQTLNEHLHLTHPPKETTPSVQVLSTFVSSCTQTDLDELDLFANNPDPNSENLTEAACHSIQSDHNYLKSLNSNQAGSKLSVSNSNNESPQLQENDASSINQKQSSVSNLNSSFLEDNDKDSVSDDDDDVVFVVSCPAESALAGDKMKIETLNAEPEDTCLRSLNNKSDTNSQDQNDVWGIGSRPLEVVSEVEIPMESHSESSPDDSSVKSKHKPLHSSEKTSNQYSEKAPEAHHSAEQAGQEENSSETERRESSPEKLKTGLSKKQVKPKTKESSSVTRSRDRTRSLRSYSKVENIHDRKLRSSKRPKKPLQKQASASRQKKTPAKKTPGKKTLQSDDVTHEKRTNQESGIPQVPTEISFGLHDRYQVQTQDLQEDLKLQNLAHPGTSSTKRKQRSFLEYLNFGNFLRRSKRPK